MLRIEKLFIQGFKSFCDPTEVVLDQEGITAVVGPNGCGKCVDGSTLVTLADGREAPIRDLVNSALEKAGEVEDFDDGKLTRENPGQIEILSLNPRTLRLEPRPIAAFIKRTATPTMLRVRTRSGREVTATPYHPLFTLENGQLRALKAEDLKAGLRIALPRQLPVKGKRVEMPSLSLIGQFQESDNIYIPESLRELPLASNPNLDVVPGATTIVKDAVRRAGLKIKPNRKAHPKLSAYVEQRCDASRQGLLEIIKLIELHGATPNLAEDQLLTLFSLATSDVYWDEIVEIEEVTPQDEWVYDLSIAETHNFVAGNIIVHNSNVADAINWVIGEQRAKMMRGAKMEDVIFQGSRNRQPSGMAEVLLTMVVQETFEIRGEVNQPETEALRQAEESLDQADAAVGASVIEASVEEAEDAPETPTETTSAGDNPGQPTTTTENSEAAPVQAIPEQAGEAEPAPIQAIKKRRKVNTVIAPRVFQEGERISVARRLYRTGESEYEMNGRACRLREIQDLFAGTGLGGAHYAIIEQGRIGQVLSAKPLDRRALIEDAAGVSKFKMRQHSAELKLDASKLNLSRITDILTEIERQQNSLKRQAARARRYQRLRQEMRDLMRAVYVVDYRATTQTIGELQAVLTEVAASEAETAEQLANLEQLQTEATQHARATEEELNEARSLSAGVDLETERTRQQHNYLNEQLQSLGSRSEQFARDQAVITERRDFIAQETARLRAELSSLEQEINSANKLLTEAEDHHREQLARDATAEHRLEEARRKVYESVTAFERWRQLKRQFTDSVDRGRNRLRGLAAESERAREQHQQAQEKYAGLSINQEEALHKQQTVSANLAELTQQLSELRLVRDAGQNRLVSAQRDQTAVEHRLKSLNELDQRRAYFSEAVQALMKRDPQLNGFKILGTLADFVQVETEHEALVETALRDELQYVVTPTFDDALGAIDYLKAEGAGRATFLVIGLHGAEPVGPAPGDNGHEHPNLAGLLGLRTEFAEAFRLALPGLANARIVNDPIEAVAEAVGASLSGAGGNSSNGHGELPALTTLSRTGERVVAGRLISGGSYSETGMGVLALKREITELTGNLELLGNLSATVETELFEVKARIASLESERGLLDGELRQTDQQLAVLREQLQQSERDRERAATHIRVVEQETVQAESELQEFEAKLLHASAETEAAEIARTAAEQVVLEAQAELAELRRNSELRSQELSRMRAEFAAQTERRRGLQNDIRRLDNESADLEGRFNRARLEAIETDDLTNTTQTNLHSAAEQLQDLTEQQQQRAAELAEKTAALAAARERLDALEVQLRAARESATELRERRARKEIEKARLSSNLEHLIQTCQTELNEDIAEVCARLEKAKAAASLPESTFLPPVGQGKPAQLDDSASSLAALIAETERDEIADEPVDDQDDARDNEISFWQVPDDFDLISAKSELEAIRAKIDGLGPVNLMALEELTEIEERFEFLSTQKLDIEKAIADTQAAIAEIKRRSRERFTEAFYAINENFKVMFQELFGGGQGEMRLIDESDILESGIEIIAQPPGKRLQNVLLLSGGEKAMTALALVMAIFKYRPSPFCLLDEVDAPLDEVNIARFADKVIEMSANTQFVIITHSKRTMEAARTLYGVTMEDPGVSKLISVKFT